VPLDHVQLDAYTRDYHRLLSNDGQPDAKSTTELVYTVRHVIGIYTNQTSILASLCT